MLRKASTVVVSAFALVWWLGQSVTAQGPVTIDQLVAKNLQAKGGLEKMRAVQTIKETSRMVIQGMDATLTVYLRRPNQLRQEIVVSGKTIINAFDGTTAWLINPLTGSSDPTVVSGPMADVIKEQSDFDGPLVDYKTKGYKIELVGSETLNGKPVQHLKVTRNQQVQHLYLDNVTGLEVKIVSESEVGQIEQELSDYRDVEGVKLPFSVRTVSNGTQMGQMTVESVQLNVKLDDALFKMPGKTVNT
jgi:outer membrane lipoprotein-sorting protein